MRVDPDYHELRVMPAPHGTEPTTVGRYALHCPIASGGMGTVHLGRLLGPVGFSRIVAIKQMHSHVAADPSVVASFLDEARLAARVRHPNVVSILDVVAEQGVLWLVMDYIEGESLSRLVHKQAEMGERVEPRIAVKIMCEVLTGLHGAHEAFDEGGQPLCMVHRDVSPQNVMVGVDGVARLTDFGVAKAAGRIQTTQNGKLKGKLAYMAPEQIAGDMVDRRADIYGASAVLWEVLTGRRLFDGDEVATMYAVLAGAVDPPSKLVPGLPAGIESVVMRGLSRDPEKRFSTALMMADALERALPPATTRDVARWCEAVAGETLRARAQLVAAAEKSIQAPPSLEEVEQIARAAGATRSLPPKVAAGALGAASVTDEVSTVDPVTSSSGPIGAGGDLALLRSELREDAVSPRHRGKLWLAGAGALGIGLSFLAASWLAGDSAEPQPGASSIAAAGTAPVSASASAAFVPIDAAEASVDAPPADAGASASTAPRGLDAASAARGSATTRPVPDTSKDRRKERYGW